MHLTRCPVLPVLDTLQAHCSSPANPWNWILNFKICKSYFSSKTVSLIPLRLSLFQMIQYFNLSPRPSSCCSQVLRLLSLLASCLACCSLSITQSQSSWQVVSASGGLLESHQLGLWEMSKGTAIHSWCFFPASCIRDTSLQAVCSQAAETLGGCSGRSYPAPYRTGTSVPSAYSSTHF